jgi:hypothetical protein
LLTLGANVTNGLLKVIKAEYNPEEHASVTDFVATLKDSSDYSEFFAQRTDAQRLKAPTSASVSSAATGQLTNEQIRALQQSSKPEERSAAVDYLRSYREANGGYPPGF